MVIKLDDGYFYRLTTPPVALLSKNCVTRMLTRDLFAVAYLLVFTLTVITQHAQTSFTLLFLYLSQKFFSIIWLVYIFDLWLNAGTRKVSCYIFFKFHY